MGGTSLRLVLRTQIPISHKVRDTHYVPDQLSLLSLPPLRHDRVIRPPMLLHAVPHHTSRVAAEYWSMRLRALALLHSAKPLSSLTGALGDICVSTPGLRR